MIIDSEGIERQILAIVPARGGSKGIPMKNIRHLAGLPLLAHTALTINDCEIIDRAVVSTDHPEISKIAKDYGLEMPEFRPTELAGDDVGDLPVLVHSLTKSETKFGERYDIVLMLQPTSPVRTKQQIVDAIQKIASGVHDTVWSVSPTDLKFHPDKQLLISGNNLTYATKRGPTITARQQLQQTYHRNGIVYAFERETLLAGKLIGNQPGYIVIGSPYANIDDEDDFEKAERLMRANGA
jgi:CMP-N,N'-diacetyllegionaminic acid synthase